MLISIKNKKLNIYVKLSTFKTQIERKKNLKLIKKSYYRTRENVFAKSKI